MQEVPVILFALLTVGICFCDPAEDTNNLYNSLLPDGKPLFEIASEIRPQQFHVQKQERDGLVFEVIRSKQHEKEVVFKFNEKVYLLHAFKIIFDVGSDATLEIQFEQQPPYAAPTNILITTTLTETSKLRQRGPHGLTSDPIRKNAIQTLIREKKTREKTTHGIQWIVEMINKKKPLFYDIRRNPATLIFVSPPVVINTDVFDKLRELKDDLKSTYKEKFKKVLKGVGSNGGSGRRLLEI